MDLLCCRQVEWLHCAMHNLIYGNTHQYKTRIKTCRIPHEVRCVIRHDISQYIPRHILLCILQFCLHHGKTSRLTSWHTHGLPHDTHHRYISLSTSRETAQYVSRLATSRNSTWNNLRNTSLITSRRTSLNTSRHASYCLSQPCTS